MARGSIREQDKALTSLARVQLALGPAAPSSAEDRAWLIRCINGLSTFVENQICHRRFRQRTYTHDDDLAGGNLPRLDGTGTSTIFLPNLPVLDITTLKRRYDEGALVAGPDEDFWFDPITGELWLTGYAGWGNVFPSEKRVVEVVYEAGFVDDDADGRITDPQFGWDGAGAALQQAVTDTVVDLFKRRRAGDSRVQSVSTEAGAMTFDLSMLLPMPRKIIESYRAGIL